MIQNQKTNTLLSCSLACLLLSVSKCNAYVVLTDRAKFPTFRLRRQQRLLGEPCLFRLCASVMAKSTQGSSPEHAEIPFGDFEITPLELTQISFRRGETKIHSTAVTVQSAKPEVPSPLLPRNVSPKIHRHRYNAAMNDPSFLRKRTANILKLTDPGTTILHDCAMSLNGTMKVDRKTFHFLLDAWAFSGEADAIDQARRLLRRMQDLSSNPQLAPDVRSYTKVINAISRTSSPTAGHDADKILNQMVQLSRTGQANVEPNMHTYTAVLEAHAHAGLPNSAERAQELCLTMIGKYFNGEKFSDKDGETDDQLTRAVATAAAPTSRAFNAVLVAHVKSVAPDSAKMAQNWLARMQEWYDQGIMSAKPQAYHYNMLISAWANSGQEGSAQRAEELLRRMEQLYQAGDNSIKPTTISYNSVIDAYAKSGVDNAAQKAEELLRHMENLYESGDNLDTQPNVRSFNAVLNAWAKSRQSDAARQAQDILDFMEKLYKSGNHNVRPDVHSFCTVINAWARSSTHHKADRAMNLFREMKRLYYEGNPQVRPNVVAVNAVLNACAYSDRDNRSEQSRSIEIAHSILRELDLFGKPDQVTYGTFLQVFANQMSNCSTREQIVQVVFRKCCRDGQLGYFVLQQLQSMMSEVQYRGMLGMSEYMDITLDMLPGEWSRNVVTDDRWQQRQRRH